MIQNELLNKTGCFQYETNQIKILEENHYYPFGLKHGAYNQTRKGVKYKEQAVSKKEIRQMLPMDEKFKYYYQEQERQDELGLNWDSFKYRNYDYAIGRFMSVDPLAEKYAYNGVYNFSENRVVDSRELEGKEKTIAIYGPNNTKVIMDESQYDENEWDNIRSAYFKMTHTRKGGGDWNAYSKRETPPLMGTLSLYYGSNGLLNVFYEEPNFFERFTHSFGMGMKAFKTFFIYPDSHVEGSAQSVEFTGRVVSFGGMFASIFVGGGFATAGELTTALKIKDYSSYFGLGYSLTQSGTAFMQGDSQNGTSLLFGTSVSYGGGKLVNSVINLNPNYSETSKYYLKSVNALMYKLFGQAFRNIFDYSQQEDQEEDQEDDTQ